MEILNVIAYLAGILGTVLWLMVMGVLAKHVKNMVGQRHRQKVEVAKDIVMILSIVVPSAFIVENLYFYDTVGVHAKLYIFFFTVASVYGLSFYLGHKFDRHF